MATKRFPLPVIESYMPSIDARMSQDARVVEGRNFTWDSKGPKSGFGALQLSPFPIVKAKDVQSFRIKGRSLTFTQDAILSWRNELPYGWDLLHIFSHELTGVRNPWQVIYLSGYLYMAHPLRGFFEAEMLTGQSRLTVVPKIPGSGTNQIPGLPLGIKGMLVVRGRAILVNDTNISWSGVGDLTDLTPELGGPGTQRIDGIAAGDYVALTSYQQGFIVWTTKGAVIAEYIGGDEVWRFDAFESQERPISAWGVVELSSGVTAMLTNHGLFYAPDSPQAWTPDFNEFFREYVQHAPQKNFFFRVEYDLDAETVYVLESESGDTFNRAFALKPTLNKFGLFNVESYGMGQLTTEDFGYIRHDGIPFRFANVFFREEEPDAELGYDRHAPRIEKQMTVPSSTARSRALTWPSASPEEIRDVSQPGWFAREQFIPAAPNRGGMDSYVHIGYLRDPAMNMSADAFVELHEISIHGIATQPIHDEDFATEWNSGFFYPEIEDWNYAGILTPSDIIEDWSTDSGVEDYQLLNEQEDWLYELSYSTDVDPEVPVEDWNVPSPNLDLARTSGDYPAVSYTLSVHASQDGITVDDYDPELAKFNTGTQEFTTITSGSLHYLRIEATAADEWYRVQGIDLTLAYGGQQK